MAEPEGLVESEPILLSIPKAAREVGVGYETMLRWVESGRAPSVVVGTRRKVNIGLLRERLAQEATKPAAVHRRGRGDD